MKHLFYVHSGITYLVSIAAIGYLKLSLDDIVIISGRSMPIDKKFQGIILSSKEEDITQLPSYGSAGVLKELNVLRKLDRRIERAVNHRYFTLYLPSEKNYLMQFLQSHRLCVRRNFIEEGLLTYRAGFLKPKPPGKGFLGRAKNLLRFPFHLYRTNGVKVNNGASDFTVYVGTQTAQRSLSSFTTVLLDVAESAMNVEGAGTADFASLFIFDAVVEMNLCAYQNFMEGLENFIAEKVPRKNLAIKFHPFQKEYGHYLSIFDKYDIQYTLLGAETIPEVVLAQNKVISVYGLSSSVLFYAKDMGHEVYSFSNELVKLDVNYKNYVTHLIPNSIIEYLKLI